MRRGLALAAAVSSLLALSPSYAAPLNVAARRLPPLVLWAWERPEDLRAAGAGTGVAFLAQTIALSGDRFRVTSRRQPLRIDPRAVLLAVTRIETPARPAGAATGCLPAPASCLQPTADPDALAAAIARSSTLPRVVGVQVDFDATASERAWYRDLLTRLRARLAPDLLLSITALASWCAEDDWLADLPIDEAVPMLFRMGPFNQPYRRLAQSPRHAAPRCRRAVGVSLDEPQALEPARRRVYVFNTRPWTARTIADAERAARR